MAGSNNRGVLVVALAAVAVGCGSSEPSSGGVICAINNGQVNCVPYTTSAGMPGPASGASSGVSGASSGASSGATTGSGGGCLGGPGTSCSNNAQCCQTDQYGDVCAGNGVNQCAARCTASSQCASHCCVNFGGYAACIVNPKPPLSCGP